MAPLATAFVVVLPNMAGFAPAAAAGVRSANMAAAGTAQGTAFGMGFAKSASKLMAAGVVVGLGVLIKDSVKAAGDFQAAMVRLTTSAGETGTMVSGNLKIVADGIKAMAGPVGTTIEALGKAMYTVESGSFHGADALKVLRAAAEGAKAENADLTKVTNATTTALVDYHLSADKSAEVVTKLVAATAAGKTTFEQLTGALHSVLPVASAAGVSLDDILGSLASMTLHGISAEQATQNLADAIRHMQNPTNVQAKELALLGLTTNQLADDLRTKGLSGTLGEISDRIRKLMPPGSQQVILQLKTALGTLSPVVRKLGMELINGSISYIDYRKAARDLTPIQASQAMNFATLAGATHRIGDEQVSGAKTMQSYAQALAKATGDATGMNVALMLTGDNAGTTATAIGMVKDAAVEAGDHVKGWGDIQETFNFKMSALKATIGGVGIALGETLLPVLGRVIERTKDIIEPMADWIHEHEHLTTVISESLIAFLSLGTAVVIVSKLAAAFRLLFEALRLAAIGQWLWNAAVVAFEIITSAANIQIALYLFWCKAVAIATRAWAIAQWLLNAAFSPMGLIVIAIVAVVAAIVYAYFHFDKFRKIVDVVLRALVAAFKLWWAYVKFVFTKVKDIIMNDVVPAVIWFWQKAIVPAFKGIIAAAKLWWDYIKFVFGLVKDIIMNVIVPVVMWLYEHVFHPVFTAISFLVKAWWVIIQVIFAALKLLITEVIAPLMLWLYEHIWKLVFQQMWEDIKSWWNVVKAIFDGVVMFIQGVFGPMFMWLWHSIIEPAWTGIKNLIVAVWENGLKQAFEAIVNFVTKTIPDAFEAGIGRVGRAWDKFKEFAAGSINFVIRYVINDGIIKAWNTLAGWLGVKDRIPNVGLIGEGSSASGGGGGGGGGRPIAAATGGLLYGPGGPTDDKIPIMASAGEYIIPARVVQGLGARFFDTLIGRRKPKRAGDGSEGIAIGRYAEGGLVGLIMDPAGWVGDQVNGLVDKIPGAGIVRDIGVAASRRLITALVNWVKGKLSFGAGGGIGATQAWLHAQAGKPYGWAMAGPGSYDCSGIVSSVWNMLHGKSPYSHTFSTMNEAPYFPNPGMGMFTAGWANAGERGGGSVGHTAGWLAGLGFESTGSSGVRVGPGTTPVASFAHLGHMASGGLVRSFDRGGRWPTGTLGINTSGATEHVSSGGDMAEMITLLRRLISAVENVAPGVGVQLTGAARGMRQVARAR